MSLAERLFINNVQLPLSRSLNPSLSKSIKDILQPDKTKAESTKTVTVPRSKEADTVFDQVFDFNIENSNFDPTVKADCRYEVGGIVLIQGYCQLKSIEILRNNDFDYKIIMYGTTANLFVAWKDIYMDVIDLSDWDHPFTAEIQQFSWASQVFFDGGLIPFALGNGYVYPVIDYGMTSDLTDWYYKDLPCSFYLKTIIDQMFLDQGFTFTSVFFDSSFFSHLIIPFSPEQFNLTSSEIADRTFRANTPEFTSTGTDTINNLPKTPFSAPDVIIFTNEVNDAGGNYDNTTGIYTAIKAGAMKFTFIGDISATFTPDDLISSLTQTSEIVGYFRILHNGLVVDTIAVFLTVDQTGGVFTVGVRSTADPTTYPDTDYEIVESWSVFGAGAVPLPREKTVPNRFVLTWSDGNIGVGDTVKVDWIGFYSESVDPGQTFFETIGGAPIDGEATITISAATFTSTMVNNEMAEGNTLLISKLFPDNIKQLDFFMGVVKEFNLFIVPDPLDEKNLFIEPRDDYLGNTQKNIHTLIDRSKKMNIQPMGKLNAKEYIYTYKSDADYFNQKYEARYNEIFGERRIESENDFNQRTQKNEVIFSPTLSAAPPESDFVIPTIIEVTEDGTAKSLKHNIRILYYDGLKPTSDVWSLTGDFVFAAGVDFTTYPYAGMWDDPYNPTLSLEFGLSKEVFYDDTINLITATNNNLTNQYHLKQLYQITDKNSKLVECFVDLSFKDYSEFTFDLLYFFDKAYWRLQEIKNFNPIKAETTKCVFLKFIDVGDFVPGTIALDDADDPLIPAPPIGGGGTLDPSEKAPTVGGKAPLQPDGNAFYSKTVEITGKENYVNSSAKWVYINGDGNKVFAGAMNVKIENGNNNVVDSSVTNITIIGTDGLTIRESNVTYVGGQQVCGLGSTRIVTASEALVITAKQYEVDASGGDVTITIDTRNLKEGWECSFKKTTAPNKMILDATPALIDDDPTLKIGRKNDAPLLYFDGTNLKIV